MSAYLNGEGVQEFLTTSSNLVLSFLQPCGLVWVQASSNPSYHIDLIMVNQLLVASSRHYKCCFTNLLDTCTTFYITYWVHVKKAWICHQYLSVHLQRLGTNIIFIPIRYCKPNKKWVCQQHDLGFNNYIAIPKHGSIYECLGHLWRSD